MGFSLNRLVALNRKSDLTNRALTVLLSTGLRCSGLKVEGERRTCQTNLGVDITTQSTACTNLLGFRMAHLPCQGGYPHSATHVKSRKQAKR